MKRALLSALMILTLAWSAWAVADRPVHPRFDLASPVSGSPFPSDLYTVADRRNRTGRRVNLPRPEDCSTRPSDCNDLDVVNTMDGFNLMPRISVPFDGEIDPGSVSASSVFIVELAQVGEKTVVANRVGINQVVWDPATLTLHVESDQVLRQTARYAAIVTDGILDTSGRQVKASHEFKRFIDDDDSQLGDELKEYRGALIATVKALKAVGVHRGNVVVASVFTTVTATATLENIRDYLKSLPPPARANFAIGPDGSRAVFARTSIQSITFRQQMSTTSFVDAAVPLAVLDAYITGAVGTVAWGTFVSPQFIDSNPVMTAHGTLEMPMQFGKATLEFVLFLPSAPRPAAGWPVAFLGHGGTTNIHTAAVWNFASSLAAHGFASIAINAIGRGFGPMGTLRITKTAAAGGTTVVINAGGRTIDQDGNGVYVNQEGAAAQAPYLIIGQRDAVRQTAIDYMQLVRVIQAGIDVDDDGSVALDASKMVFLGNSFAVGYEMCFLAVEPDVGIAAVGSPGGLPGRPDLLSMRPSGRTMVGTALAARSPSLLNSAYGLTSLGGISVAAPYYNENIPLRDLPPVTNDIPGAMAIQEHFDRIEWVQASSDAAIYAPHLEFEPLTGVPAKSVMVLYAKGDMTAPNPRTTALVRAGVLREKTIFYRNDIAFAEDPTVSKDPHTFLQPLTTAGVAGQVARGGQTTIAEFFVSGTINQPEPARFFEFPIVVMPEDYSYIP